MTHISFYLIYLYSLSTLKDNFSNLFIGDMIYFLCGGQKLLLIIYFLSTYPSDFSNIFDFNDKFVRQSLEKPRRKAQLYGSSATIDWIAIWHMIGVPLHSHFQRKLLCLHNHMIGMQQNLIKTFFGNSDCQYSLLVMFGCPARTIHHPQKIGLYPSHSCKTQTFGKAVLMMIILMCDDSLCDLRFESLIYYYRLFVILCQYYVAFLRPLLCLFDIGRQFQRYLLLEFRLVLRRLRIHKKVIIIQQ